MSHPRRILDPALAGGLEAIRSELDVPTGFPPAVDAAAEAAAMRGPVGQREDLRDQPLVTIDPPGSRDLDQAVWVSDRRGRLLVTYAIADVGAFVQAGDPIDQEAWSRGVSRYAPDGVTPLHPRALSEGAASLLPGQDRPAVVWKIELDAHGDVTSHDVRRALVCSDARLTYQQAHEAIEGGTDEMLSRLARVGRLRAEREWVRGGISLQLADQEVAVADDGQVTLRYRAPLPVEGWNAQISLLTGIVAGTMMADAGIGVLRTLPAADAQTVDGLRRQAWALGLPWPTEISYPDFVRTLDPHDATQAAMIASAATGLRGAGYVAFDAASGHALPEAHRHEAIAATYAHATAPLRRLVDRYSSECVLAISGDREVPGWVREHLLELPRAMGQARGRAGALDRAVLDLVEAHVLRPHVGAVLPATVIRTDPNGSTVQLHDPAVTARVPISLELGAEVSLLVEEVDTAARSVVLRPPTSSAPTQ